MMVGVRHFFLFFHTIFSILIDRHVSLATSPWQRTFDIFWYDDYSTIRYADDLMLFATSSNDLIYMLEALIPELAACGLQLNSAKPKILPTSPAESYEYVDVCGEMIQVIHAETVHKYLGRNLGGNFWARRNSEFAHRLPVAWNKFQKYKHILLNKHVPLVLRLKLFDAMVSPAMLFGLATLPLTKGCLQKLGVVQKRMLRSIVG